MGRCSVSQDWTHRILGPMYRLMLENMQVRILPCALPTTPTEPGRRCGDRGFLKMALETVDKANFCGVFVDDSHGHHAISESCKLKVTQQNRMNRKGAVSGLRPRP